MSSTASYSQRVALAWVLPISVIVWGLLFFAYFLVPGAIENKECGLDPFTEHETAKCAPVAVWASVTFGSWMASPLLWVVSALALVWVPEYRIGMRWLFVGAIPVLPMIGMASVFVVEALYGPTPV